MIRCIGYQPVSLSDNLKPGQGYWILLKNISDWAELQVGDKGEKSNNISGRSEDRAGRREFLRQIPWFRSSEQEWKISIKAIGKSNEDVFTNAHNVSTVYIGMDNTASVLEAPLSPPRWTVKMRLKASSPDEYYCQDIRRSESRKETWIVKVEMNQDESPDFYPLLSWDSEEIAAVSGLRNIFWGEGFFRKAGAMKLMHGETGEILVNDMSKCDSYQTRQKDGRHVLWYTIVFEPKLIRSPFFGLGR